MIGWVATTGSIGIEPLILFLIIFLWTPPHFWALSLNRAHDYARAGVPMLPVIAGRAETKRQICYYSLLLAPVSILPWALGPAGLIYATTSALSSATMIMLASKLECSVNLLILGQHCVDRSPETRTVLRGLQTGWLAGEVGAG